MAGPPTNATFSIYPNPNDGSITLNFPTYLNAPATVTITNMLGQKVTEIATTSNEPVRLHIDAGEGVYFVMVASRGGYGMVR